MNKLVRTKSPTGTGCKFFSEIVFEQLYTGWTVVVHIYCRFSLWHQMAPQQSTKFRTSFFGQFCTSLRKDSVANYASIWTPFFKSVTGADVLCNALNIYQILLLVAPQDSQNCGRYFAKRKESDAEFAGNTAHGYY